MPLLWPQLHQKTGQISIPEAAQAGDYDLVVFGSPTWFFRTAMPLRSYLASDEAAKILAGEPFVAYVVCRRYWSVNLKKPADRVVFVVYGTRRASASPSSAGRPSSPPSRLERLEER